MTYSNRKWNINDREQNKYRKMYLKELKQY